MNPYWERGWQYPYGPGTAQVNFPSGPVGTSQMNAFWNGSQYPSGPAPTQTNLPRGPVGKNQISQSWNGWQHPYGPGPAQTNLHSNQLGVTQMSHHWNGWPYPYGPGPTQTNLHSNPQGRSPMFTFSNSWQHPPGPKQERANLASGSGPMYHTASQKWLSNEAKEREKFHRVQANLQFVAPNSPFVPRTWDAWLEHRVGRLEDELADERRQIDAKTASTQSKSTIKVMPAFGGKQFNDYRSSVFACDSIWRPGEETTPARPLAPWPDVTELKYEGALRSWSGHSRFLPLPRVPGNGTVTWKQRPVKTPSAFDAVGLLKFGPDEKAVETDDNMVSLIGNDLLREVDR